MKVKLLTHTPEVLVGECAKICYGTKPIKDGGKDITTTLVHQHKHLASLRFAFAVISVEGISIACQNQIVRSKHLDFMVQSKRYVNADKGEFEFIMPEALDDRQQSIMDKCWYDSLHAYTSLLNLGVKKEDARAILPMNTSTKMNISGNLQAWDSFFKLRLSSHAQAEINNVAIAIFAELQKVYPQVFTKEVFERYSN